MDGTEVILLEHCLRALRESISSVDGRQDVDASVEIVLVLNYEDDASEAKSLTDRFGFDGVVVCDQPGFDFARKCNLGAQTAHGDTLVFLNDDTDICLLYTSPSPRDRG